MGREKPCRAAKKSVASRRRTRPVSRKASESLDAKVLRLVREAVRKEFGLQVNRLDDLASEASLSEGDPIPAAEVWSRVGR